MSSVSAITAKPGSALRRSAMQKTSRDKWVAALWEDFGPQAEHGVFAMMLSGLGATPLMEQYLMAGHVVDELTRHGAQIWWSYAGNYVTSLNMNGLCLTLLLLDEELQRTLNFPAAPLELASL